MWITQKRFRQMEENIDFLLEKINENKDAFDSVFNTNKEAYIDEEEIGMFVGAKVIVGTGDARIKKTYTLKDEALPKPDKDMVNAFAHYLKELQKLTGVVAEIGERIDDLEGKAGIQETKKTKSSQDSTSSHYSK